MAPTLGRTSSYISRSDGSAPIRSSMGNEAAEYMDGGRVMLRTSAGGPAVRQTWSRMFRLLPRRQLGLLDNKDPVKTHVARREFE